jgi:hypothetical protein
VASYETAASAAFICFDGAVSSKKMRTNGVVMIVCR